MKRLITPRASRTGRSLLVCAGLGLGFAPGAHAGSKPATTPTKPVAAAPAPVQIPQSVFNIPSSAKEGRNPFFPRAFDPLPITRHDKKPTDSRLFALNGITSPPKPTAIVNGQTLAPGEQAEVRLPDGSRQLIRCEEVGLDFAVIIVNGQRRELHLRAGF